MTTDIDWNSLSLQGQVSEAEWQTRVELAACYRLAAHYRMSDQIYTHISARIPGTEHLLLNPYGTLFDEIRASLLVKVDLHGAVLADPSGLGLNKAGFLIHSAIHKARPQAGCVMHTHTRAGVAVAAQRRGLLPLSQHAMRFHGCLSYHDYEGVVLDPSEQERLIRDLGENQAMILRQHGLLTWGRTVREAFELMYFLEMACQIQIDAQSGGAAVIEAAPELARKVADQFRNPGRTPVHDRDWPALCRLLERQSPTYRT
ncbi:class II aldolase/adducin family protein [Hydrogenophaga sp. YM1]|uniref:class II aldolase/adducin family protein n=1 Tax=Hydrogenophaga TaxID=47420 RepID=UPI0019584854|nr:class II aldolase/adducin family protein [Hydrogenophaga sp. YM1]QRR32269.1 class II aldolase/adducin family protein [Hydrogenophaga sp. YM1]